MNMLTLDRADNNTHNECRETFTVSVGHFDLRKIAESGQVFRWYERADGGFTIHSGRRCITAYLCDGELTLSATESEYLDYWKHYLALDEDYSEYYDAIESGDDAYASHCARVSDGIRILNQDLFEMMVSFVISQNNNIPRIRGCIERIVALNGGLFPTAKELYDLDLSGCGLGYRESRGYMKATAQAYSPEFECYIRTLDYDGARAELLKIHGVGPKVADCICLFGLGHKEAFPRDTHVNDIISREYGGIDPSGKWQGYAGVVQQWMFYEELKRALDKKK